MYLFIAQNGEVSPGIPVVFFGFVFVRCLCRFFGRFAQGSAETVNISGDFLAGELSEIFVFCSVAVTIFRILSVYLFIIIIFFFCWALIRHITQSIQVFFCEICEVFKHIYFEEHLRTIASDKT